MSTSIFEDTQLPQAIGITADVQFRWSSSLEGWSLVDAFPLRS